MTLKVVCVYKTGGPYDAEYPLRLHNACLRHLHLPFDFVCLTNESSQCSKDIFALPLLHDLKGRYNMQEVFRVEGPCLALGLDTILLDDITPYARIVLKMHTDQFLLHRPFNKDRAEKNEWANGIMGWNGDWKCILDQFISNDKHVWLEQQHTSAYLQKRGVNIIDANEQVLDGVVSYKKHCKNGPPERARVVCFHGKPKPHEVENVPWVQQQWW